LDTLQQQYQQDELLALWLQKEERSKVRNTQQTKDLKALAPLEYKLLNEQFGVEPEDENEEEETEYNYIEPFQLQPNPEQNPEPPILYDPAQKKEDKEIAHIEKRMPEKRVNAAPVAMHHKDYATRNKGKVLVYGSNRSRTTPKTYAFPLKGPEYEYGFILKILGGLRFQVFCYSNCRTKLCRMSGKLRYAGKYLCKLSVVLIRIRSYQDSRGDIVYKYSDEEYNTLLEIGELVERDPKKIFPSDVWQRILSYLDPESRENLTLVYEKPDPVEFL